MLFDISRIVTELSREQQITSGSLESSNSQNVEFANAVTHAFLLSFPS